MRGRQPTAAALRESLHDLAGLNIVENMKTCQVSGNLAGLPCFDDDRKMEVISHHAREDTGQPLSCLSAQSGMCQHFLFEIPCLRALLSFDKSAILGIECAFFQADLDFPSGWRIPFPVQLCKGLGSVACPFSLFSSSSHEHYRHGVIVMIHLSNITKQHGSQVLFREAGFQTLPGSRNGLVGPNGFGKTTIFRIITGEEEADGGEITRAKRTTVGYFSQDAGEMADRTALEAGMAGSAETMRLADELREMEAAMCEPMADDELASLLERYGQMRVYEGDYRYYLEKKHDEATIAA
jgi:hypothetical protein